MLSIDPDPLGTDRFACAERRCFFERLTITLIFRVPEMKYLDNHEAIFL